MKQSYDEILIVFSKAHIFEQTIGALPVREDIGAEPADLLAGAVAALLAGLALRSHLNRFATVSFKENEIIMRIEI